MVSKKKEGQRLGQPTCLSSSSRLLSAAWLSSSRTAVVLLRNSISWDDCCRRLRTGSLDSSAAVMLFSSTTLSLASTGSVHMDSKSDLGKCRLIGCAWPKIQTKTRMLSVSLHQHVMFIETQFSSIVLDFTLIALDKLVTQCIYLFNMFVKVFNMLTTGNWPEDPESSRQALLRAGCCVSSWSSRLSSFSSVSPEGHLSLLGEAASSGLVLWILLTRVRVGVCVEGIEAGGFWLTRLVRTFLKPTATSNICRLSAAAMMRLTLCLPRGSLPV